MTKLKKKVFYTIFIIISVAALSFILTYNISKYVEQSKNISNSLNIVSNNNNKDDKAPVEKPAGEDKEPPEKKDQIK